MIPKHIRKITDPNRIAHAPYNFVELPDKVVPTELDDNQRRDNNQYYTDRSTGKIECTLTTESPLYIRCGLTREEFEQGKEAKDLPDFFYTSSIAKDLKPVIPGSSLRGMLRTLVEIASYSKIDRVSGQQHFFYRAVAAKKDDPLSKNYKDSLKNVMAGYLVEKPDGWYVRPAQLINGESFVWIKENKVTSSLSKFISMQSSSYLPQYFINISFGDVHTRNNRLFAGSVSDNPSIYDYVGVLVSSGNMAEGSGTPSSTKRTNHCIVCEPDANATPIKISDSAILDYCSSLTEFQKQDPPFSQNKGVLKNGRCIFYCKPKPESPVVFFGQSPNFRIPYSPHKDGKAASVIDFIPDELKSTKIIDLADSIFGFVRDEKREDQSCQSVAGRLFITDAISQAASVDDLWLSDGIIIPKILTSPKPTTFQHYLVQPSPKKSDLKHYGNKPINETVIRGHKLYWHKGENPIIRHENPNEVSDTQKTNIKPIKPGVNFRFTIYFENLSDVELGSLLWVLDIAQNDKYRLSLGMGKPLGMGAVKITHNLHLDSRKDRYKALFVNNQWLTGSSVKPDSIKQYIDVFDKYICRAIGATEPSLKDVRRIKMMLAMLSWSNVPDPSQTRYMEIERDATKPDYIGIPKNGKVNEYAERPVLPTPLQVIGDETENKRDDCQNPGDAGSSPRTDPIKPKKSGSEKKSSKQTDTTTGTTSFSAAWEKAKQQKHKK